VITTPVRRRELLLGMAGMLAARRLAAAPAGIDVAYLNARVWTGMPGQPRATAFGTLGNRFGVVGENAEVSSRAGRRTRVVDLQGAFVMPGFIDNHTHFLRASFMLSMPELRTARTPAEFTARVGHAARALQPGEWLQGGNWDEQLWGGELPTRDWIDTVTPHTPVAVVRLDQHLVLLNTLALRIAGIDRHTPAPDGGLILRGADGEPTGLLKDTATQLVQRVIPPPDSAAVERAIEAGIAHALSRGLTQVHVTELDWITHDALRRLRGRGEPGLRFYSLVPIEDWERVDALVHVEGRGDDWVRWGGVKGLIDGSLGARTALFREPYADDSANRGLFRMPPERLLELVRGADSAGLHVAVHAIGDEGNRRVLDMFAEVAASNGHRDRRFRIEHVQHLVMEDAPRFARQGVIASMQPYHAIDDGRWAGKPLGSGRLQGAWAVRTLLDASARVTFGSDWPVAPMDPLLGIDAAVHRRTIDGAHPAGWVPEQRITVNEALTAYTTANAYAGFQDDRLGVMAPGYIADFVVFDTDLVAAAASGLSGARVLATFVDGRLRHGTLTH
jgi:predicted amidohydrolase YtcJ